MKQEGKLNEGAVSFKETSANHKEESDMGEQNNKCKFCEGQSEFRQYLIPERNRMDRDNLCEILTKRLGNEVNWGE